MGRIVGIAGWLTAVLLVAGAPAAHAAEIKLISAGAVRIVVMDLAEKFAKETGHSVKGTFGPIGVVREKLASSPADVVIATDVAIDDLMQKGAVVAGTRADLAHTGVGVGVRENAPKPDISTPEAFKQALLAAKSIVYVDPALGATSGIHVAGVLQKLGIADAVKSKTVLWQKPFAAEAVVSGQAELVVNQISEILPVKGVAYVGPLPRELQKITVYSGGIAAKSEAGDAARAFLAYLTRPEAKVKFAGAGLDYKDK